MNDKLCVTTLRCLALDMIDKANSGHPGMALGSAAILHTIYSRHLTATAADASWIKRDRFVLSSGHASALLYSVLHMAGFDISLDDLKAFREAVLDSETGLEAQIEKQKELIKQEQELAEKQAALTYATQYVSDYEQNLGEELAAGQKEFMTGVIANMADEFDGAAEQYFSSGNNGFFDALGGAWSGASDNSLSDWEDIDSSNVIEGIDEELLKQAGFEGEFTGDDVKNLLIDIKGRISENHCEVQPYEIMEIIQKDTKKKILCVYCDLSDESQIKEMLQT